MSKQGYFSIIQYSEQPERVEFINVGVVLFSPEPPSVLVQFADSMRRVERMFDVSLGTHFKLELASIQSRIESEFSSGWRLEHIERFISLRSGKLRLSPARSVLVEDGKRVLADLYERLVDGTSERPAKKHQKVGTKLKECFEKFDVVDYLDRPGPVALDQGVTIKAPFAYQNGAYNLISAISLSDDPNVAINNAAKSAVEGKWLYDATNATRQKRLVVVGEIGTQEHNFVSAVTELMEANFVKFFRMDDMEQLVDDIRSHSQRRL